MINKQECFLVMSEAEFEAAIDTAVARGAMGGAYIPALKKAEAACRAREVPEWATHICRLEETREFGGWNVIQLEWLKK